MTYGPITDALWEKGWVETELLQWYPWYAPTDGEHDGQTIYAQTVRDMQQPGVDPIVGRLNATILADDAVASHNGTLKRMQQERLVNQGINVEVVDDDDGPDSPELWRG